MLQDVNYLLYAANAVAQVELNGFTQIYNMLLLSAMKRVKLYRMPVINQQTGDTLSEQSCLSPHTVMQCLRQLYNYVHQRLYPVQYIVV